jgi:2-polyprenyl-3-methyl-5-hydroxy-6-metoxy-1,4-benzoquinol methylase
MGKDNHPGQRDFPAWEKRSIDYGATWRGVLFQGMPDPANKHFHKSHLNFILQCIKDSKATMRILDAGCGYGRLSLPLAKKFPQAQICGMDLSPNYVKLYRKNTGRDAFIGAVDAIPEGIGTFDYIIVVTVLMYLPKNELPEAFSSLFAHLNAEGKIIVIEPDKSGIIFQTGCGLTKFIRKTGHTNTGGTCFSPSEIPTAVGKAGGSIIGVQRIPATTFFFILIYLMTKTLPARWTRGFFRILNCLDDLLKSKTLPTLWSFYLVGKNNAA